MNTKFTRRDFGKMAFAGIPVASAMLLNSDLVCRKQAKFEVQRRADRRDHL